MATIPIKYTLAQAGAITLVSNVAGIAATFLWLQFDHGEWGLGGGVVLIGIYLLMLVIVSILGIWKCATTDRVAVGVCAFLFNCIVIVLLWTGFIYWTSVSYEKRLQQFHNDVPIIEPSNLQQ